MEVFVLKIITKPKVLIFICTLLFSSSVYAFMNFAPKKIELSYEEAEIVLPNGHIMKDFVASNEDEIFIPYDLAEHIISEPITWDHENKTLIVGNVPTASVMSDKLKIYHYDYDAIHAFLYCPDAKTNQTMTMANETHHNGYSFTNVLSASFNLSQTYHQITGFLGCEDFKSSNGQIDFYLDDTLIATEVIKADQLPAPIKLNVTNGTQLKLVFSGFKHDTQINFVDVYIE